MSQPVSRILHPFDMMRHPEFEPEVERAILARWTSNRSTGADAANLRRPARTSRAAPMERVFPASRALGGQRGADGAIQ